MDQFRPGYWTSPGGATPAATLYSAVLREIAALALPLRHRAKRAALLGLRSRPLLIRALEDQKDGRQRLLFHVEFGDARRSRRAAK
jgi:hypothetical protein